MIISGCQKLSRTNQSCGEQQSRAAKDAGQERVFKFKEFPRHVFVVSPLKFLSTCQSYVSSIIDNSLKVHFPVMIFLIAAENVCFRNFPAVFSRSGGVVTGGCFKLIYAEGNYKRIF